MNETLQEYVKVLPVEVRDLFIGLGSPENLGILVALMKDGKMRFDELEEKLQISPGSLRDRLEELQDGSLVNNFYEKAIREDCSYYDATDISEQIIESVYKILYKLDDDETAPAGHDDDR